MGTNRVIQRMNETAIKLIKSVPSGSNDRDRLRGDTGDVARTMALLNVAMFDAANGIFRDKGESDYDPIMVSENPPKFASEEVASLSAGRIILKSLFSSDARRKIIADSYMDILSDIKPTDAGDRDGRTWGRAVAAEILAERQYDVPVPPGQSPIRNGGFNRNWNSQYAGMQPFVMNRAGQFLSDPPPSSSSNQYAEDLKEVLRLGARLSSVRTLDQTRAARAWNGGGNTSRPTGAWFEAAIELSDIQGLPFNETARLFCLLGITICDCMISSWNTKRTYDYWRPQDALRMANLDGNSKTEPDLSWLQLSGSIGGSPEYTSGTATFAGGASTLLAALLGTDVITFSMDLQKDIPEDNFLESNISEEERGEREYNSISDAAVEAGKSRIYNGIHYEFSNKAGMEAGRKIAQLVLEKFVN